MIRDESESLAGATRLAAFVAVLALGGGLPPFAAAHEEPLLRVARVSAAIRARPADATLRLERAALYLHAGECARAVEDYEAAARLLPPDRAPEFAEPRARALLALGRIEEARSALRPALAARPDDARVRETSARIALAEGDAERAAEDFVAAVRLAERPAPELWLAAADALAELPGDGPERALALLDGGMVASARGLDAGVALHLRAIGIETRLGRFDAALARIARVEAAAEIRHPWIERRAETLLAAGRIAEARDAFAEALADLERLPPGVRARGVHREAERRLRERLRSISPDSGDPQ